MIDFPCIFQVVPDNIVAQELLLMHEYNILILPINCSDTIPTKTFIHILQLLHGINMPKLIFMEQYNNINNNNHKENHKHTAIKENILHLNENGSIPLHELVDRIYYALNTTSTTSTNSSTTTPTSTTTTSINNTGIPTTTTTTAAYYNNTTTCTLPPPITTTTTTVELS